MAEIILEQISKRFSDGTAVLKDVNLTIRDGEFFILVGPSGCGKSTLLNLIAGLDDISDGNIRVNGRIVNELNAKDRGMAMVFQSYALYPHMTVRGNIEFPLRMAKVAKEEIERRVRQAADILQITSILDRKPASLSGGQRQRVAMGRALVREPATFLLDEPLSNLDARLRSQMRGEIARLQRQLEATMIYVTHDQTEAMTLGDRVAVLHQGQLLQTGTPRELYRKPANLFVAAFIGSPAINFLPASVRESMLHCPLGTAALPIEVSRHLPTNGKPLIVGIRPEHLADPHSIKIDNYRFTFDAAVDRNEWLGAEQFLYFKPIGTDFERYSSWSDSVRSIAGEDYGTHLCARFGSTATIHAGEKTTLASDIRTWLFFDPDTSALIE